MFRGLGNHIGPKSFNTSCLPSFRINYVGLKRIG
jgi:hypothetical protein